MIVDSGVLYALADRDDRNHASAREVLDRVGMRIVPEPVVVEVDQLILKRLGVDAEVAFLRSLQGRWLIVEPSTRADRERAAEVVAQYRDLRIGYVDAVIVAMAERLGERIIATVDRRHFGAVRPRHVESFTIVP